MGFQKEGKTPQQAVLSRSIQVFFLPRTIPSALLVSSGEILTASIGLKFRATWVGVWNPSSAYSRFITFLKAQTRIIEKRHDISFFIRGLRIEMRCCIAPEKRSSGVVETPVPASEASAMMMMMIPQTQLDGHCKSSSDRCECLSNVCCQAHDSIGGVFGIVFDHLAGCLVLFWMLVGRAAAR